MHRKGAGSRLLSILAIQPKICAALTCVQLYMQRCCTFDQWRFFLLTCVQICTVGSVLGVSWNSLSMFSAVCAPPTHTHTLVDGLGWLRSWVSFAYCVRTRERKMPPRHCSLVMQKWVPLFLSHAAAQLEMTTVGWLSRTQFQMMLVHCGYNSQGRNTKNNKLRVFSP